VTAEREVEPFLAEADGKLLFQSGDAVGEVRHEGQPFRPVKILKQPRIKPAGAPKAS